MTAKPSKGKTMQYSVAAQFVTDTGKEVSRAWAALEAARRRHADPNTPRNTRNVGEQRKQQR